MALLKFRDTLLCGAKAPIVYLREAMAPPMRRYFVRRPVPGASSEYYAEVRMKPGLKETDPERRIFEILSTLWELTKGFDAVSLPIAVDELDRLIRAEPRAQTLVSSTFASLITDLSILTQCLGQLSLYQPWASCFDHDSVQRCNILGMEFVARRRSLMKVRESLEKGIARTVAFGTPFRGRFTYPAKKRQTEETVTAMRLEERNLDAFWAAVDRVLYSSANAMRNTRAGKLLAQPRVLQRTPPWVEPEVPSQGPAPLMRADMLVKPSSERFFQDFGEVSWKGEHPGSGEGEDQRNAAAIQERRHFRSHRVAQGGATAAQPAPVPRSRRPCPEGLPDPVLQPGRNKHSG